MKPFLTIFIFSLLCINVSASNPIQTIDSVYQYAKAHPSDSVAIKTLNNGCNQLYGDFTDTIRFYAEQQVYLAQKGNFPEYEARGYNMWGVCMELSGNLDSAISLYNRALSIGERLGNKPLLIDIYNNLGIVYSYQGLYELSVENTLKALELAEERKDSVRIAMLNNNLGLRYYELNNVPLAIEYLEKAVANNLSRKDTRRLASNYVNLGNCYFKLEDFDKALTYSKKSVVAAKEVNRKYDLNTAYNSIAFNYLKTKQLDLAALYNDSARTIAEEINDDYGIQQARLVDGYILQNAEEYEKAIPLLESTLAYFNAIRYLSMSQDILASLATCYHEVGKDELAYDAMRKHAMAKDSIFTEQKDKAMQQVLIFKEAKQARERELLNQRIVLQEKTLAQEQKLRNLFIVIGVLLLLLVLGLANRYRFEKRTKKILADKNALIEKEKALSDELLLNILPAEVAEELKENGVSEAKDFDEVTVLFTDFVEFTKTTQKFTAKELVEELNTCFKAFDEIITRYKLEKIKTIGDAYMAASGLNKPKKAGAREATLAALEMQDFMMQRKHERLAKNQSFFEMRCGLNTGPVVAGIVGVKKFQFDIWGDTVNTASRMETNCEVNRVNITESTYDAIKNDPEFAFESRGSLEVKGKGNIPMWYVSKKSA